MIRAPWRSGVLVAARRATRIDPMQGLRSE